MDFTSELLGSSGWGGDSGPSMAGGGAYGGGFSQANETSVGGLTINKQPNIFMLAGVFILGASVVWLVKR